MSDKPEDAAAAAAAAAGADKGGKGGDKGAGKGAGKKKDKKKKDGGAGSQRVPEPEYIQERIQIFDRLYAEYQEELKKKESKPITITLPDGKTVDGKSWVTTPQDIVSGISQGLAKETVISKVNGELWDLPRVLEGDCTIEFLKFDNPEAQAVFWHSSAHVLGEAMELKYGGCLCYGPPIENGFYYDIHLDDKSVAHEDYSDLEQLANKGIKEKQPFLRLEMKKEDLLEMFKYNEFKHRIINERITTPTTTVYRCGPLIDLCRGPHVPDTGRIKAFAVTKNSSAYWEGNADAEVLQRVYGISFPDKKLMKEWKVLQEEAAKRDHRKIGRDQGLFFFHELSPGSCFFYPRGAFIYNTLIEFMKGEYRRRGFQEVITPNIFNSKLWETSGHWEHYSDDMFHVPVEKETFALKPMNCPGHCLLFGSTSHSYRELPLRFADFGVLHRNELSGALHGLTRVRRFQQDDAHIFCMESQIEEEIKGCLDFLKFVYGTFGFTFQLNLSTRPKKFLGEPETWDRAEKALENALNSFGQEWFLNAGDGAFYGPKIDITISDALKRKHQCATIQLDFQLPQRFELQYMAGGSAGGENDYARPVIIHRAILGSVERMIAILTESFGGKWPFWLSPRQACVIPVRPQLDGYAEKVRQFLHDKGFMVEVDVDTGTTLNKKIRNAQLAQFNFILVVGNEEEDNNTVNVRTRDNEVHGQVSLEEMAVRMEELRVSRALTNNFGPAKASEGSAAAEPAAAAGGAAAAAAAGPSGVRATTI